MDRELRLDRTRSASLRTPTATLQFLTCEAAVEHWRKLAADDQAQTALSLTTGELYQPEEINLIRFVE